MDIGLEAAKSEGHEKIKIEATLNAVSFYEHFGFSVVGQSFFPANEANIPKFLH